MQEALVFLGGLAVHLAWLLLAQFATNPSLRSLRLKHHLLILLSIPVISATILVISWDLGSFTASCISLVIALLLHQFLLVLCSSRHRVLWGLAWNNLNQRRRNTALMMMGLLIGAAMISSSLVIGDSIDATIRSDVLLRQDTADIEVRGYDPLTGSPVEMNESRMRSFGALLETQEDTAPLVDGFAIGRTRTVSVLNAGAERAEPDARWWAMDPDLDSRGDWSAIGDTTYSDMASEEAFLGRPVFIINQNLADEVGAVAGDVLQLRWSSIDENLERHEDGYDAIIWKVVENSGQANAEGGKGKAIFSTLETAQSIQGMEGLVNRVRISAEGGVEDSLDSEADLYPYIRALLDEVLIAEDAGLIAESDTDLGVISVGRNDVSGLEPEMVQELRNLSEELVPESSLMELLQAPLGSIRSSDGSLLTGLHSSTVDSMLVAESGTWYIHPDGVSHRSNSGGMDSWGVPSGTLVRGAALHGGSLLVAHDDGLSLVDDDGDEESIPIPSGDSRGVVVIEGSTHLLMLDSGSLELYSTMDLESWTRVEVPLNLSSGLQDGELHLHGDGLLIRAIALLDIELWSFTDEWTHLWSGAESIHALGGSVHVEDGGDLRNLSGASMIDVGNRSVLSTDSSSIFLDDGTFVNQTTGYSSSVDSRCDGRSFVWTDGGLQCSFANGVLIDYSNMVQPLLPSSVELEGLGRIPLLVIASTGDSELPEAMSDEVRLSTWADPLFSDEMTLVGAMASARGNHTGIRLQVGEPIPPIPNPPGQPGISDIIVGVVNFSVAEHLSLVEEDERSLLMFSSDALKEVGASQSAIANLTAWMDQVANTSTSNLFIDRAKHDGIEVADRAGADFSALFIVFGTFTMLAGVLLVVNIFVMLAEERKSEMGMARALGLQRSDLRALFLLEGSLASVFACSIGSVFGLFLGWLVASAFTWVLSSVDGGFVYDWTWSSLLIGAVVGFLVSWVAMWATALRNSRLNVVAAMRNLPQQHATGPPWWSWLIILGLGGAGLVCSAWFILSGGDDSSAHGLWNLIGILFLLAVVPLLLYLIPHQFASLHPLLMRMKRRSAANTMGVLGFAMVFWVALPDGLDPVRASLEPNEFSFIIVGVSSVAAGVLLLTSIAPMLASFAGRAAMVTRRLGPVVPTALAYPLATPFRTAMTIGMFSLTVFSVVVLAGYSAQFESYSETFVDDVSGDFDMLGTTSSWDRPLQLEGSPSGWNWSGEVGPDDFDGIGTVSLSVIRYADATDESAMDTEQVNVMRGVDSGFADHGGLPLHIWDNSLGDDADDVWRAVSTNPNVCILDASFGMEFQGQVDENSPFKQETFSIGESILVIDSRNPEIHRNLTVIGFLDEGSLWSAPGIWVSHPGIAEEFGARYTRLYLSMPDGTSLEEMERVAEEMELAFIDDGMEVEVIEVSVKEFQGIIFGIFNIFQAYVMLGLAVGIAGLGVITVRAVSERAHQTGVLRAIGFQRRMVVAGYVLEFSWISLLGILNGLFVGTGFHWYLYQRYWVDEGVPFTMPWDILVPMVIGSWLLVLLVVAAPVRRAASIHPAEALREVVS